MRRQKEREKIITRELKSHGFERIAKIETEEEDYLNYSIFLKKNIVIIAIVYTDGYTLLRAYPSGKTDRENLIKEKAITQDCDVEDVLCILNSFLGDVEEVKAKRAEEETYKIIINELENIREQINSNASFLSHRQISKIAKELTGKIVKKVASWGE